MVILAVLSVFIWFSWNPFDAAGWFLAFIGQHSETHLVWVPVVASLTTFVSIFLAYREIKSENPFGINTVNATNAQNVLQNFVWLRDYSNTQYFIIPFAFITKYLKIFEKRIIDSFVDRLAKVSVVLGHLIGWFDRFFVDGGVNLLVFSIKSGGQAVRNLQNGKIQSYFIVTAMGVFLLILWLVIL